MKSVNFINSTLKSLLKGYFWQVIFVFLITLLFAGDTVGQQIGLECVTPLSWQPKLGSKWNRDANNNNVEDTIETMFPDSVVNLILCLNQCPRSDDSLRFEGKGNVKYVGKFLSAIVLHGVKVSDAIALAADNLVAMVQLDHPVQLHLSVSNPAIKVRNSDFYQPNTVGFAYPDITGTGVNIAILDTGVDDGVHESLPAAKFVGGYDAFADPDGDLLPEGNPDDCFGHGTHVAGIALGQGVTFRGIAPDAGLVDIRVMDDNGSGLTSGIIRGIEKCIQRRANWNIRVMNMSLGGSSNTNGTDALSEWVNRAVQAEIVVVVSAGNSGINIIGSVAAADDAITVAASSHQGTVLRTNDQIADFSSRGPRLSDGDGDSNDEKKPDVAAPGTNTNPNPFCSLVSGCPKFTCVTGINSAQCNTFSTYMLSAGTSMAAPHVAGLAALIIETALEAGRDITALSVKRLIIDCAEASLDVGLPGWEATWGWGLVDGFCAINELKTQLARTDLGFADYCHEPGNDLWWRSSDISTAAAPKKGVPNTVSVKVTNFGPAASLPFRVRVGVYPLGNSLGSYTLGEVAVGALAFPGNTTIALPWTPQESFVPPTLHVCVKAQIIYPFDTNTPNNCAQRNIDIEPASAANYRMLLVNPTGESLRICLEDDLKDTANWTITFDTMPPCYFMRPFECPRNVEITLTPTISNLAGEAVVNIACVGDSPHVALGGVTIVAQHNCTAKAGDANGSGTVNITDIIYKVNYVFKSGPGPLPLCRGDDNGDGNVNLIDIIHEVNYVFKGGSAPVKSGACCL